MIEVVFDQEKMSVLATGHAGSAPKGEDLVCAGVTTLVLTLADNVECMKEAGMVEQSAVSIQEGVARIMCIPNPEYAHVVELVFRSICRGFSGLAAANPQYMVYGVG